MGCLLALCALQVLFRHIMQRYLLMRSKKEALCYSEVLGYLLIPSVYLALVDQDLSIFEFVALGLAVLGYMVAWQFSEQASDDKEAKSLIQTVKSLFRYEDPKELEEVDVQLWSTYGMLGI